MKLNRTEFRLMNNPLRAFIQENYEIKAFLNNHSSFIKAEVLEIGCGNGNGAYLINKYFQPNNITGVDIDSRMVALAKKNYPQFSFIEGDVSELPFPDNYFGAAFDFGVIHHIPKWQSAFSELHRTLKKGGQIFIEDFSLESFQSPLGRLLRKFLVHPYGFMPKREEVFNYINKLGFRILKKEVKKPLGLIEYYMIVAVK